MSFKLVVLLTTMLLQCRCYPIDVTGKNINYYQLTPNAGSGSYNFNFGTKDGTERSERGYIKKESDNAIPQLVITGSYKYDDPMTGDTYEVSFIADEQGYRLVPKNATVKEEVPVKKPIVKEPRRESKIIKLDLKPVVSAPIECPPGQCTGSHQSKITFIKTNLRIG